MDPNVKLRTDLLPQLGQGLLPFPFAGEVWFDPQPPKISEVKTGKNRKVTIEYPFRQLQFGNFVLQPIVISYERNGELQTTKTDVCQYAIRSVIAGTDVEDIQPRSNDGLDLIILRPVGFPKTEDSMKSIYLYAKIGTSAVCFSIAALLLSGAAISFKRNLTRWLQPDVSHAELWGSLLECSATSSRGYYLNISSRLNRLLAGAYGVSLYSINRNEVTDNFKNLVNELDKLYRPNAEYNSGSLQTFVKQFCKDRRYK
jgi:hypothetical protein